MSDPPTPTPQALELHEQACRAGEGGYFDPVSRLYVLSSVRLRTQGSCCGAGCRHCPFDAEEQRAAGRPAVPAWPWPPA